MRVMTVMPRQAEWTVDDLDDLPEDDGLQYELLDGLLVVSPAPIPDHQFVLLAVYRLLYAARPAGMEVLVAPTDWRPDRWTSVQPDALVIATDKIGPNNITETLALAVEVLSPSTRRKDLVLKRSKYEEVGVPSYWVVDPLVPSVTVWELGDEGYVEVGTVRGDETLEVSRPFPVTITPATLR